MDLTDAEILRICDGLSVCTDCFRKVYKYLTYTTARCHSCFLPIQNPDFVDLKWIGDEQFYCCKRSSCTDKISNLDHLAIVLDKMSLDKREEK